MVFALAAVLLLALTGPVLTFARLLQLKEWRFDRLREHLRQKGIFLQLFGWGRPAISALGLLCFALLPVLPKDWEITSEWVLLSTWGLLAWFTLFQGVLGQRKRPVWTVKAFAVALGALLVLLAAFALLVPLRQEIPVMTLLFLLPLATPIAVTLTLLILTPLDRLLKRRMLDRARCLRMECPELIVIGITGSVGKSTTKEMLAHVLRGGPSGGEKAWKVLVTPAHINTELGIADVLLRSLKKDHTHLVVEMGAYRMREIALLCSLTHPLIGITTFVSDQHLGLFGSREALLQAKGELFAALPPQGFAFLNADSEGASSLAARAACPVLTAGTGGHASFEAYDIEEGPEEISFTLRDIAFRVPLHGTHQVVNVVLVAATAEVLGIPLAESAKRLKNFQGLPQTFEKKTGKHGQIVLDDTHNASSASFHAAIEWARTYPSERKVLVTSGLIELGGAECIICQELGTLAREVFQDVIFLDAKCARSFEQGFGQSVRVPRSSKKLGFSPHEGMLIVCEGRIPEPLMEKLLA